MKPECKEFQKNIARSILGDLPDDEIQSLEQHLATCPLCRSEKERYLQTLELLKSAEDEPIPRHFFVHPEEKNLGPWASFRLMKPRWQAMAAAIAAMFVLTSIGWGLSLTREEIDVAALKQDILAAVDQRNREARELWIQQVREEIERSGQSLTQQQQNDLKAALARLDSRFAVRLEASEGRAREDTQKMATGLYRTMTQQRAQDLRLINLRFDTIETRNALETRQTDAILGTLLQAADLRLK